MVDRRRPALEGDQWRLEQLPNGNLEFSLVRIPIAGRNIIPELRDQGMDPTCVFEAALGAAETDVNRNLAENQQRSNNIRFNKHYYVEAYEERIGMTLADDKELHDHIIAYREDNALDLFEADGVLATSDDWEGERLIHLRGYRKLRWLMFPQVAKYILRGQCLMGGMPVGPTLETLGAHEIYQFYQHEQPGIVQPEPTSGHAVVFVGYGLESTTDRPYLVFMNANGPGYADGGFGRVYFDQICRDRMYLLNVEDMPRPHHQQDGPGTSSSSSEEPEPGLDATLDDNVDSSSSSEEPEPGLDATLDDNVDSLAADTVEVLDDDVENIDVLATDMLDVLDDGVESLAAELVEALDDDESMDSLEAELLEVLDSVESLDDAASAAIIDTAMDEVSDNED